MQTIYKMTPEEIQYCMMFVGETFMLGSGLTRTGRGKRLFAEHIPENLVESAGKVIERCKYVKSHGMKNDMEFTLDELMALHYLIAYCKALYSC